MFIRTRELPLPLITREVAACGLANFDAALLQRIYTAAVLADSPMPKPFKTALVNFLADE